MTAQTHIHAPGTDPSQVEAFLSGAYDRIRRATIALAATAVIVAALVFGWPSALGALIGSLLGYVNLVWLHHGSALMIQRMLASLAPAETEKDKAKGEVPGKLRLMLSFAGRYVFVIATAYVILKSFPGMLFGFVVALFFPILAAMGEGVYEAWANRKFGNPRRAGTGRIS